MSNPAAPAADLLRVVVLRLADIPPLKLQQRRDRFPDFIDSVGHCSDHPRAAGSASVRRSQFRLLHIVRSWSDHSRLNSKSIALA
jgi:hypothetical protein